MFKKIALLGLMFAFTACPFVSSLDSTTVEQLTPQTVRVTTKLAGLLTAYSTEVITKLTGKNLGTCVITTASGKPDQGVICKGVPLGFVLDLETVGKVNARVTQ